ncbi:hypothetical protein D3C72_203880 [compost metagenome]
MHAGSLGASIALHVLLIGAFILPMGKGGARPAPPMPKEAQVLLMELAKIQEAAPKAAPKPVTPTTQGTVTYPKKKKDPPKPKPKPEQVANQPKPQAPPTPKPSPTPAATPDPMEAKLAELRKHPYFKDWPEEKLRNLQLPHGMKSWDELAKMTAQLDGLDWKGAPPALGQKEASAGTGGGFGLGGLFGTADGFGFKGREKAPDGSWQLAYQELNVMFVARWAEGAAVAKVFYYPFGGKEDPAKTFDIAVEGEDTTMVASMNLNHQLIMMGQSPLPVSSAGIPAKP